MNGSNNDSIGDSQRIAQIMGQFQQFKWIIGIFVAVILAMFAWIMHDVSRNDETIIEIREKISRIETDISWIKNLLKPSVSGQIGNN